MQFPSKVSSPTTSSSSSNTSSSANKKLPTSSTEEEIVELPSTSKIPTSIIARHQLAKWDKTTERPFTVTSCTNFANTVITATNVNSAKRQFSASANSSSSRRSCSIVSISSNPIRRISPPSRAPIRALSFATQPSIQSCNGIITSSPSIRRDRSLPRSQSATVEQKSFYQVLAFLYCGTLEAAADARWLCENKISYLINLTGVSRLKIRSCPCSDLQYHSPTEYLPKFNTNSTFPEISAEFHKINEFIQEARSKNACVLIFNSDGYDLCQAVAIQYELWYYGGLLVHHISSLQIKVKVKVKISPEYLEVLSFWEKEIEKKNPRISNNKSLTSFSFKINRKLAQI